MDGMTEMKSNNRKFTGVLLTRCCITALFVTALMSCQDLTGFIDHLDDEVMLANDRYLEVVETFPEQNDQNLSPKIDLLVVLDRDVDPTKVLDYIHIEQRNIDGTTSVFGGSTEVTETLTLSFSPSDKTLTISPHPFWAGGNKITVSLLQGARATDGSLLRWPFSWSFFTVKIPVGVVEITDGVGAQPGYTNVDKPPVKIFFSNAGEYYLSSDLAIIKAAKFDLMAWVTTPGKTGEVTVPSPILGAGDQNVYVYFKDPSTNTISDYLSDSIFVDLIDPSVEVGASAGPTNSSFSRDATASDGQSGIFSHQWSSSPAGVTFGTATSPGTTITGPSNTDQMYTVSLNVTDKAGRSTTDSFSLDWDSQAPVPPAFTVEPASTSTTDNTPTWNWAISVSTDVVPPYNYNYRINSGSWQTTTNQTYTHSALPDGYHSFDVGQYDNAGNFSYSHDTFVINMANISPYDNQTKVPTSVTLNWPSTSLATYGYHIYEGLPPKVPVFTSTGETSQSSSMSLGSNKTYHWVYSVTVGKVTTYFGPYDFDTVRLF
jgi:hypothetical protein